MPENILEAKKIAAELFDFYKDDYSDFGEEFINEYPFMIKGNWTEEEQIGIYAEIYTRFTNSLSGCVPDEALSEVQRSWLPEFEEHISNGTPFSEKEVCDWLLGKPYID